MTSLTTSREYARPIQGCRSAMGLEAETDFGYFAEGIPGISRPYMRIVGEIIENFRAGRLSKARMDYNLLRSLRAPARVAQLRDATLSEAGIVFGET